MYVFVYVFVSTKIGHEYSAFFDIIPRPRPFKMGIFDMNTGIDAAGSGDMSSTQYNRIWSSANSFFRDRPSEFATTTTTFTENCVPLWKCIINCILKTHIMDSNTVEHFIQISDATTKISWQFIHECRILYHVCEFFSINTLFGPKLQEINVN